MKLSAPNRIAAVLLALGFACSCLAYDQRQEEELGRKEALQIESQVRLSKDTAVIERVQRIGQTLAKIANEHEVPATYGRSEVLKFSYKFKVIEEKDVNAFSLAGGIIYVNTGLLELAASDDELAGVLAHEIAHAAHHHMLQLVKKQSRIDRCIALVALAGMLGNMRSRDLNNLLFGAQLLRTGKLSGYTLEAENDADRTAVAYLARSDYKPEGMVSFMRKLDELRDQNPTVALGIFQTHPLPYKRVTAIAKAMRQEGFQVDLRKVRDVAYAKAVPSDDGATFRVLVGPRLLWEPAPLESGGSSKERAEEAAATVNALLDAGLDARTVRIDENQSSLFGNGRLVLNVRNEDLQLAGQTREEILRRARDTLIYAIRAEWLMDRVESDEAELTSDRPE